MHPLARLFANDGHDAFEIGKDILVREAQYVIAARCEPAIANLIVLNSRLEIMCFAVDLDHELRGMAGKIRDVRSHRDLPPKLQTVDVPCLDVTPQQCLGARHRPAKRLRSAALLIADGGGRHAGLPPSL